MGGVSAEIFTDIMKALKRIIYFLLTAFELADFVNKPDRPLDIIITIVIIYFVMIYSAFAAHLAHACVWPVDLQRRLPRS